jgi:hypothetical protein
MELDLDLDSTSREYELRTRYYPTVQIQLAVELVKGVQAMASC